MPEEPPTQPVAEVFPAAEKKLAAASSEAEPTPPALIKVTLPPVSAAAPSLPERLPPPRRRFGRHSLKPVGRRPWRHWALCLTGLVLFIGCVFGLLHSGPLFDWSWLRSGPAGNYGKTPVVIDPGHGGWDSGAIAQGVVEKDLNLDVGLRVARVLQARGVTVKLTRETDRFIPLEGRANLANGLPGAVFVSIHFNDDPEAAHAPSRASGIETYYSQTREMPRSTNRWMWAALLSGDAKRAAGAGNDPAEVRESVRLSQTLADSIQGALIASTSAADRGIKERSLYVTRRVRGPAVLVEGGFVSHPAEARRLGDPAYRQQLAEAIAGGILKYLDATAKPSSPLPSLKLASTQR